MENEKITILNLFLTLLFLIMVRGVIGDFMSIYDQMVFEGKFKEVECLILNRVISLEDLSEEAFEIFKEWIEGAYLPN